MEWWGWLILVVVVLALVVGAVLLVPGPAAPGWRDRRVAPSPRG